jgi:hypothetical protein
MAEGWGASWGWGLLLIAITVTGHALGVVTIVLRAQGIRLRYVQNRRVRRYDVLIAAGFVGAVGLLLGVLHGLESATWAVAFVWLGAAETWHSAILYSLDAMTTRGGTEIRLTEHWQLLGALEAANGMLLFGISTAFVFAVLQRVMPLLGVAAELPPDPPGNPTSQQKDAVPPA